MQFSNLEEVIRYHIPLPSYCNSRGFYSILCKVCNDHGKKGLRAGFTFDHDGKVGYHCFNCGLKSKYDPTEHITLSENMKKVLTAFGVPESDYKYIYVSSLKQNSTPKTKEKVDTNLEPPEIKLPTHFYKLGSKPDDIWSAIAYEYLRIRKFTPEDYTFFLSTNDKWLGRLIIPIYKNRKIIYYQGRKMDDSIEGPKYRAPFASRECVFFNYKEIFKHTEDPLFIVEGFFDAWLLNGVAIFGNDFTPQQIEILNKSPRKKVYIPDKEGKGYIAAKQALKNGWQLGLPNLGACKDIDEAINHYGKLYTLKSLVDNIYEGIQAKIRLDLYCNDKERSKI